MMNLGVQGVSYSQRCHICMSPVQLVAYVIHLSSLTKTINTFILKKKLFIDTKNGKPISHAIKRTLQKENAMNNIFLVNKF